MEKNYRLIEARNKVNLSQEELVKRLKNYVKISLNSYTAKENGKRRFYVDESYYIIQILNENEFGEHFNYDYIFLNKMSQK